MIKNESTPDLSRLVEDGLRAAVNAGLRVITAGLTDALAGAELPAPTPVRTPVSLAPSPALFAEIAPSQNFPILIIGTTRVATRRYSLILGVDKVGMKYRLAVVEGSTRNTKVVRGLLAGLREHGLDVTRPTWCLLDGTPALTAAVRATFALPVIQHCQRRKIQSVRNRLPAELGASIDQRMRQTYQASESSADGEKALLALAAELDLAHPPAAATLRTGLVETLEITDWHVPRPLFRSLHAATAIRSLIVTLRRALPDLDLRRPELVTQALLSDATLTGHLHRVSGYEYMHVLNDALNAYGAEPGTDIVATGPSGKGYARALDVHQLAVSG